MIITNIIIINYVFILIIIRSDRVYPIVKQYIWLNVELVTILFEANNIVL